MNRLMEMVKKQVELQERIFKDKMNKDFEEEAIKNRMFWLHDTQYYVVEELHEMCRELPYMKHWKNYEGLTEEAINGMLDKAAKEYADVVHFVINIGLFLQIRPTAFKLAEITKMNAPMHVRCQAIKQETTELTKVTCAVLTLYEKRASVGIWDNDPFYPIMQDIIRHMLTIAAALHLSKDDIYNLYMDKNKENHIRQDNNY